MALNIVDAYLDFRLFFKGVYKSSAFLGIGGFLFPYIAINYGNYCSSPHSHPIYYKGQKKILSHNLLQHFFKKVQDIKKNKVREFYCVLWEFDGSEPQVFVCVESCSPNLPAKSSSLEMQNQERGVSVTHACQ